MLRQEIQNKDVSKCIRKDPVNESVSVLLPDCEYLIDQKIFFNEDTKDG